MDKKISTIPIFESNTIDFIIGEYVYTFTPRTEKSLISYPNKKGYMQKGFFLMKPDNDFKKLEDIKIIMHSHDGFDGDERDFTNYALKLVSNYLKFKGSKGFLRAYNGDDVRLLRPEQEITYKKLSNTNYSLLSKLLY